MTSPTAAPFAPGAVVLRLYTYDTDAVDQMAAMREDARVAVANGFDGVLVSEHHGNWPGYLPNPLQTAGILLAAMPTGWAAPCPILPLIRPPALLAEDVAWLAAAYPGRLGLGVAAGFAAIDEGLGVDQPTSEPLAERFGRSLAALSAALSGRAVGLLADDPAIARCAAEPVPLVSAAMSATACRRAAATGVGVILDSTAGADRIRELVDSYRAAGAPATAMVTRRLWLGDLPDVVEAQTARERSIQPAAVARHRIDDYMMAEADPVVLAKRLVEFVSHTGVDSIALRVHLEHRLDRRVVREQIKAVGAKVVPELRAALAANTGIDDKEAS